jgi:hypothetical protein
MSFGLSVNILTDRIALADQLGWHCRLPIAGFKTFPTAARQLHLPAVLVRIGSNGVRHLDGAASMLA